MNPDTIFQTMDAITNAISDSCEPKIYPDVTLQTIGDKTVIVVEIHPDPMRPYYIKQQGFVEGTYIRVAGTSRHAEGYLLKELILEGQNRYFDSEVCSGLKITDDDIKKLCRDMKEAALKNTWNDSEKVAIKDVTQNTLLTWGILKEENGEILPTNAFAYMKIIEKWGTGIPRILSECREYGLPEPELLDFDGDFRVNMYRRSAISEKQTITQTTQTTTQTTQITEIDFTENDKDILKIIQHNPRFTQKEISMELNWTIDRVKYYLNKMKKQGVIKRVGSSHNGHWELLINASVLDV